MSATVTRCKRAQVEFDLRHSIATGEFRGYWGRLVNCEPGERFVDQQDENNRHAECSIWIKPLPGSVTDQYVLMTQGRERGGRRYRQGTLLEMVEAAEKWAARRFYVEEVK